MWSDPTPGGGLELGLKASFGVRREELIVKDVPKHIVADGRTNYDRWVLARADAIAAGSEASVTFDTVQRWSAVAEHALPAAADANGVDIIAVPVAPEAVDRRGGAVFGVLVHAILSEAPFDATRQALEKIAGMEARVLGLTEEDTAAAVATVERVLRHDLLVRAANASTRGACRRETPVTLTLPDGTLVEGIVDLAFEEHGAWVVVDYKTDRELDSGETTYRRQVALYAAAIATATGRAAKGILVRV